jgi:hypothetical protein
MQLREQQPLPLKGDQKPKTTEEDLKQRSARFRQAKSDLEARMNSDEFKKMRWVKLARKKGIPYFDEPSTLSPFPIESIDSTPMKMVEIGKQLDNPQRTKDQTLLMWDWKEEYAWDLVSREVALARRFIQGCGGTDPRKAKEAWRRLLGTGTRSTLQTEMGKEVRSLIARLHEQEWNRLMRDIQQHRRRDRYFDCKMAKLVFYNHDISGKEMERRWAMLDQGVVLRTLGIP